MVGEIVTVMGRLLNNEDVRSLAEIKREIGPKIQASNKTAIGYMRDTVWAIRERFYRPATACTLMRKGSTVVSSCR